MNPVRCDGCGAVSRLPDLFVREPGLHRVDELHCPACHEPEVESEPLPGWIAALAAAGLLVYWLFVDRAAWPLFLLLLFPALTILHELLHAIPAWLLGARVFEIHVGDKRRPRWRIGGIRIALTNWLVGGGFCAFAFRRAPAPRWQHLLVTGLPLAFHLCAALILLATGLPADGEATALQVFALINAFIFLENVYPSNWSDGHQLVRILRRHDDQHDFAALAAPAVWELDDGRKDAALREARAAERSMPHPALGAALYRVYFRAGAYDDAERFLEYAGHRSEPLDAKEERRLLAHGVLTGDRARRLALVHLRTGQDRPDEALAEAARWLETEEREEVRAVVHGARALVLLELGRVEEAELEGRDAFRAMPWLALSKLVYGAVLVAKGALERGVEQLAEVGEPHRGSAAAWRAIGLAGLGRRAEALHALERARKAPAVPPSLLRRAEEALAAA